ncbi:unnamed protein product, partial [Didymodactylos carnosus]
VGSSSAIGQGKSSLLPYICSDKRHESINTAGNALLRTGCVDVLSGTIQSNNEGQQAYTIFDVHGTVQKELNYDLIRTIQYYAAILIFYITIDDLESDTLSALFCDICRQPIIVVVFDQDFDDRDMESKSELLDRCQNGLKRFLHTTSTSSVHVLLAPCASLWVQKSDNREFDEENRTQLLRQSFSDAFTQLESAISQQQPLIRSSFMIQSRFLSYRSSNARPTVDVCSFAVENKLKQLLEGYTDQTDNLLNATPVIYLQGKIRAVEKQLTRHTEEDMRSIVEMGTQLKAELNKITSVSALASFFIQLLTQKTFVELLIIEKCLEKWRSKYQPLLLLAMSNIKESAINWTNTIKQHETEEQALEKQTSTDPSVAEKRLDIAGRLKDAKAQFANAHHEMEKLENKLLNVDLTIGLFLDEIMAIANFNPVLFDTQNPQAVIDRLAVCFVGLMNRGIALHILRGRPLECPSPLLTKSIQIAGKNARSPPFVVSVIGEQSSAKSSLLNTCFGTNFRVSSGRCTIGVYFSIVHWGDLTVVLLDTEGLLSVEEASALFDNQIVTMAMLSSHVAIINHKGEFSTTLGSLIGMSLYAKTKLEANMKPALLFILRDQSDTTDEAKRKHFFPQLTTLKQALQTDANFLTVSLDDVLDISSNAVMLLSNAIVKDIDKKAGIKQTYRNKSFPIEIQEVRRMIYTYLISYLKTNVYKDFDNMSRMLASNWSVIDQLGPDLLSCKTLIELRRMTEVQSMALDILKPAAISLSKKLDNLVEYTLQQLEPIKMTMVLMNNATAKFQQDVETTVEKLRTQALNEFSDKTAKSYFSIEVTEKWKRTIISSLKNLTEQWNHIFDDRLQASSHAKIAKEVEDTLIARAEERFNQDKSPNVEQLRHMMKDEIDKLRLASQKNQQALFEQPAVITEKTVRLYNSCLGLHTHGSSRMIYNMMHKMPPANFMSYSETLAQVLPLLADFAKQTENKPGFRQRVMNTFGLSADFDKMWSPLQSKIHWFKSSNATSHRKILSGISYTVLPKLQRELRQLVNVSHPIYNKMPVMEQAIDVIEEAVNLREVIDLEKDLNRTVLVGDLAVIALRLLIVESINVDEKHYKLKSLELNDRIRSLEQSVERQIASMEDASKQGNELASTVATALFSELKRVVTVRIKHDIRQAVTDSNYIVHDNVQNQAYTSSFTMGNAQKILKYVADINRYFLEISLDSIRAIFNAVINDQTIQLESLINTLLNDINNGVHSNECKNYAEVKKIIEECANKSFVRNTKGYTNVSFRFPAALPMNIDNSARFKSAFRSILQYSSQVPVEVSSIISSLRSEAFDECVKTIKQKLGCEARCPGCGAKCAVIGDHEEKIVVRMPRPGFEPPSDANAPVKIHNTNHHLARCLHGSQYHGTNQPVLLKCYQKWTSSSFHLTDGTIVSSLYFNHFHPSWFNNLDEMARTATDRNIEHASLEQRRAWMFVRHVICRENELKDYSDATYKTFPESYPLLESLPADFHVIWNDISL